MFQRFILCSGLAAAVNLAVGYLLYGIMGLDEGLAFAFAVSVAFLCGMGVSFVLNRTYTFPASGRVPSAELRDFFLVSMGGMTLTTVLAWTLDTYAEGAMAGLAPGSVPSETVAHVCAVGLTAIYSFFAHKLISFRASDAEAEVQL